MLRRRPEPHNDAHAEKTADAVDGDSGQRIARPPGPAQAPIIAQGVLWLPMEFCRLSPGWRQRTKPGPPITPKESAIGFQVDPRPVACQAADDAAGPLPTPTDGKWECRMSYMARNPSLGDEDILESPIQGKELTVGGRPPNGSTQLARLRPAHGRP